MSADPRLKPFEMKARLMSLFKKGLIIEAKSELEAKVSQRAGACAIAVIDKSGGGDKMPDLSHVQSIADAVALPIIGRYRVGHRTEAQVMENSGANILEEGKAPRSEAGSSRLDQSKMIRPCIAVVEDLASTIYAIYKGAAAVVINSQGGGGGGSMWYAGGGGGGGGGANAVNVVGNYKKMKKELAEILKLKEKADSYVPPSDPTNAEKINNPKTAYEKKMTDMFKNVTEEKACHELVLKIAKAGKLPVLVFVLHASPSPADIALFIRHGFDGVYLQNAIFTKYANPMKYINNIVKAIANSGKLKVLLNISEEVNPQQQGR